MIAFAAFMSTIAALTGIFAIGSGRHWQFNIADYFRGKRNAILYLWVTASTIFSMTHSGVLLDYGVSHHWVVANTEAMKWMWLHSTIGFLLIAAHLFVASALSKEVGPVDKFLWGNKRRG